MAKIRQSDNVFKTHNIKLHNQNRVNKKMGIQRDKESKRWGTYWARDFYKRDLSNYVDHLKQKFNFQFSSYTGAYVENKGLESMESAFALKARQNLIKNRKNNRRHNPQGGEFKEHRNRETRFKLEKNPFIMVLLTLDFSLKMKNLCFGFRTIELFSRYQKH